MNMLLFIVFFALMIAGVPLGVSMGLSATALVVLTDLGIMSVPTSVYTGIARDVAARYAQHACGKGARYTRAHPPARLLGSLACPDRSSATRAEYRIKQLKPAEKRALAGCWSQDAATGALQAIG